MSRVWKIASILVVAIVVVFLLACVVVSPLGRAQAFSQFDRAWFKHWPFSRGSYLPKRALPILEATGVIKTVRYEAEPGVVFFVKPDDVIENEILSGHIWDEQIWGWISSHLQPGSTMIDVGAHIGTMTIRGAKAVGTQGRVIAVEPNPNTAAKLRANIAASGWPQVTVEQVACGSSDGKLDLFIGSSINSGSSSLSEKNAVEHGAIGTSVPVTMVTLDEIVARDGLTRIDVIKGDVEGAETQVITGGQESIRKFHPVIILETVDRQLRNMGSSVAELESLLHSLGYAKARQSDSGDDTEYTWMPGGK
jgi:FkbM family methyltransferase